MAMRVTWPRYGGVLPKRDLLLIDTNFQPLPEG